VAGLSDDDRVAAVGDQRGNGLVSKAHERTGGVQDTQPSRSQLRQPAVGRAVRRDHHRSGVDLPDLCARPDAACPQVREDRFVVDEVAEDREGLALGGGESVDKRPPHAEAHPHVTRFQDFHGAVSDARRELLFTVKLLAYFATQSDSPQEEYRARRRWRDSFHSRSRR
jgi:hypothetical protein